MAAGGRYRVVPRFQAAGALVPGIESWFSQFRKELLENSIAWPRSGWWHPASAKGETRSAFLFLTLTLTLAPAPRVAHSPFLAVASNDRFALRVGKAWIAVVGSWRVRPTATTRIRPDAVIQSPRYGQEARHHCRCRGRVKLARGGCRDLAMPPRPDQGDRNRFQPANLLALGNGRSRPSSIQLSQTEQKPPTRSPGIRPRYRRRGRSRQCRRGWSSPIAPCLRRDCAESHASLHVRCRPKQLLHSLILVVSEARHRHTECRATNYQAG